MRKEYPIRNYRRALELLEQDCERDIIRQRWYDAITLLVLAALLLAFLLWSSGCTSNSRPSLQRHVDAQLHTICYTTDTDISCFFHPQLRTSNGQAQEQASSPKASSTEADDERGVPSP